MTWQTDNLIAKLKKTRNSINAHVGRGMGMGTPDRPNSRGLELRSRYDVLRDTLLEVDPNAWVRYCNEIRADRSHGGFDLFA